MLTGQVVQCEQRLKTCDPAAHNHHATAAALGLVVHSFLVSLSSAGINAIAHDRSNPRRSTSPGHRQAGQGEYRGNDQGERDGGRHASRRGDPVCGAPEPGCLGAARRASAALARGGMHDEHVAMRAVQDLG